MTPSLGNIIHRYARPILIVISMTLGLNSLAHVKTPYTVDSLYAQLANARTPADSVTQLLNLYDCLYYDDRKPILYQLFETAERAGDHPIMLQTLFTFAILYPAEPEMEQELLEMAERVPESELRKAHVLYIKVRFQSKRIAAMSEEERQQKLHEALKKYREHSLHDNYDRIAYLFLICENLHNIADTELLTYYLEQLKEIIDELPDDELLLRAQYAILAMDSYINNGQYEKAIAAINLQLATTAKFDKLHEAQGRKFRNYDGTLYDCYLKMLMCADVLTDEEIEKCYEHLLHLTSVNPRIRNTASLQRRSRIYYYMAKKRFADALPIIKEQLKDNNNPSEYYRLAQALVKAAKETGDRDALLQGAKIINSTLKERLRAESDVSLSELQTIYEVEHLKGQNKYLQTENHNMKITGQRRFVVGIAMAVSVVFILILLMISLSLKSRRLGRRLTLLNRRLIDERNTLQATYAKLIEVRDQTKAAARVKSDFVENMSKEIRVPLGAIVEYSHLISDCTEDDSRSYIREYGESMEVNTDLLIRLVNDVLDLPQLESGELSIHRSPSSVKAICHFALDLVKKHVSPDVKIIFANEGQGDSIILTDPQRVEQVLIQLLTNAAKFTEKGSITFGYSINQSRDKITFTVTDTGIGVPRDMQEEIFGRFTKVDHSTQGNGLGLYIGRLLAQLLDGTLTLDSEYQTGARFEFTVPIV